jgi:universal stress protein E
MTAGHRACIHDGAGARANPLASTVGGPAGLARWTRQTRQARQEDEPTTRRFENVLICSGEGRDPEAAFERGAPLVARASTIWKCFAKMFHDLVSRLRQKDRPSSRPEPRPGGGSGAAAPGQDLEMCQRHQPLTAPLHDMGVSGEICSSASALEITRKVLRGGHDLVVCVERESQGRSGGESTVVQLSRLCPCTVWAVRAPGVKSGQHVLAAVNPCGVDRGLDREILDTALAIAHLLGRTLHVVHIWEAHGAHLLAPRTSPEELARHVEATLRGHRALCEGLMRRYAASIPRDRLYLRKGSPADLIPRVAAELDADPIVMGTAARRGVAGVLVGNTAERIVRRTDRSVVIVKSRDFASPLAELPAPAHFLAWGQKTSRARRSGRSSPGLPSSRTPART